MSAAKKQWELSINEETYVYHVDTPSLIRLSSSDPESGGISALRFVSYPKGFAAKLTVGSVITNTKCGIRFNIERRFSFPPDKLLDKL